MLTIRTSCRGLSSRTQVTGSYQDSAVTIRTLLGKALGQTFRHFYFTDQVFLLPVAMAWAYYVLFSGLHRKCSHPVGNYDVMVM